METTWVFPPTEDTERAPAELTDGMRESDFAVRRAGDQLDVWRVDGDELEWLGEIPASSLPDDAAGVLDVEEVVKTDDGDLRRALEGLETSLRMRGG